MKKIAILGWMIALGLLLCACGQDTKVAEIPACADVVAAVEAGQTFQEMTTLSGEQIAKYLDIDAESFTDMAMSMDASRATAEMIIVLQAKDKEALADAQEALSFYRDVTLEQYRDYRPDEAPKLEAAVLKTNGLQMALIVSPDAAAAEKSLNDAWK